MRLNCKDRSALCMILAYFAVLFVLIGLFAYLHEPEPVVTYIVEEPNA